MKSKKRLNLSSLSVVALILISVVMLAYLNWDAVSKAMAAQAERTQVSLFRWGELGSIAHQIGREYGTEPQMTYETTTGERILTLSFRDHSLPADTASEDHAREIAIFALGETEKDDGIDVLRVRLAPGAKTFHFTPQKLASVSTPE